MDSFGYIYKVTNKINGRLYIGQRRGTFSPSYLGSGVLISKAIRRYGKGNFKLEVIAFASNDKMLDGLEMKFIYEYRQVFGDEFLYNISDGGMTNKTPLNDLIKMKISKSLKGRNAWNKGKKFPYQPRPKSKGRKVWNAGKIGKQSAWNKGMKGSSVSQEVREKISRGMKEYRKNHG